MTEQQQADLAILWDLEEATKAYKAKLEAGQEAAKRLYATHCAGSGEPSA